MKAFTISAAVAVLAGVTQAAPALDFAEIKARDSVFLAPVTFYGAGGANYSLSIPTNNTQVTIDNDLSVSSIESQSVAFCTFIGQDGRAIVVDGGVAVFTVVAPPEPLVRGSCDI